MEKPIFSFVHAPDMHMDNYIGQRLDWMNNADLVTPFVEAINNETYHTKPDFIVFGGDNVTGSKYGDNTVARTENYMLKERLEKLEVPYYITCHGHDTASEEILGKAYSECFGDDRFNYIIEFADNFVGIFMSECYLEDNTFMTISRNKEWLEQALEKTKNKHVLFFSHMPVISPRNKKGGTGSFPYEEGDSASVLNNPEATYLEKYCAYSRNITNENSSKLLKSLFLEYKNVIVHYSGHSHIHSYFNVDNTHYIGTAGLSSYAAEYRLVNVYKNRITNVCIKPSFVGKSILFWPGSTDDIHTTEEIFNEGLPFEKNITIDFNL